MLETTEFKLSTTIIPGLLIFDVSKNMDSRGYYQEKFQINKIKDVSKLNGLDFNFEIKQASLAFNLKKGTTRGVHIEPWNKLIYIIRGKVYSNFVDTRDGKFNSVGIELDDSKVVYLPEGVGNSFQTLEDNVYYHYLQDETWNASIAAAGNYSKLNLKDPSLNLYFPIALDSDNVTISERDLSIPYI